MNRDPFLRLALIAAVSLYLAGIEVIAHVFGDGFASFCIVGGVFGAVALSIVLEPKKSDTDRRRRQRQPAEGTRGFERIE